ncbi:membrane protein [Nitrosomonas sp. PY1]|uniref:alkaline phytoceramidase n=1 Tax=Nitrosomonas sp. PY1 TaxID=1803906 RepID=UPI001FC8B794|nr:alkaline phytoceramidase [Nitrosomonas sp. PY1]GKS70446.1 membrane protein [Nitrosomonas sp. PY1]
MNRQLWLIAVISFIVISVALALPPLSQPLDYHEFADQRSFMGIPNFNDVVSNLAFLFSGGAGVMLLLRINQRPSQKTFQQLQECIPYGLLFLGVIATTFGSSYYHWMPSNDRLMWDRLPIAICIVALLSATLVDRVNIRIGLWLLPSLVVLAIVSVLYWHWTELQGAGNLNLYIVTQFYSILLMLWISFRFPSRYTHGSFIYSIIILYGLAKVAETLDREIFTLTHYWISGHTLKHLIAAYAAYRIVYVLNKRSIETRKLR